MNIKRLPVHITQMTDLSPSSREVTLGLPEPLGFLPGAFVNVFMTHEGQRMRRAYSVSSDTSTQNEISLSIRKGSAGGMSERFWDEDIQHLPLEIMGPLGVNTVDKITTTRVFLFAFGIGVSVIKGLLPSLLRRDDITQVTILTGSRSEVEILYKDFFQEIAAQDARVEVQFVVSQPADVSYSLVGHIHDHVKDLDFRNSTVYLCGPKKACESLQKVIEMQTNPAPQFLIEAFD